MRPVTLRTSPARWSTQKRAYGAMKDRLSQLAEEAAPNKDDPRAGGRDSNPLVQELYHRIKNSSQGDAKNIYQKELQYSKMPKSAPKSSVDIAMGDVWTGEESAVQVANRLAVDRLHKSEEAKVPIQMPTFRKRRSTRQQISDAREKSLDYKIDRESGPSIKDQYEERYHLAAGSGASGSLSAIHSIAYQRIDDAVRRGQFKNLPRGQKFEKDHHTSSPYIDTTEYFLNRMIQRQGAAPPWVEQQGKVHQEIQNMRQKLRRDWTQFVISMLDSATQGMYKKARIRAAHEIPSTYRTEWQAQQKSYHNLLVKEVNDVIRSYNLQAPQSARKGYIELAAELQQCFEDSGERIATEFRYHVDAPPPPPKSENVQKKSRHELVSENPDNHYGLSHLIRDLFRRNVPK